MVITHIYLRLLFGSWAIFIGLILLKIYRDKDKESIWGTFYRTLNGLFYRLNTGRHNAKVYLILGCLSIAGGLIALFYGFRPNMVGY
jgi:uncharacterized membrane protein HdeD (DUF308 family)